MIMAPVAGYQEILLGMDGIFISYRRDDAAGFAGRLYDRLVAHFGARRVFMDVEGIEPGVDFVNAIEDAVGSCRVLIVIIGDEWTTVTDAAGRRRLDDPNDFIRLETGVALKRNIRVVPVLVGGAVMPHIDELPEELHALARRQAIEINHKQWDASTGELIRTLERILDSGATDGLRAAVADDAAAPVVSTASSAAINTAAPANGTGRRWVLPAVGVGAVLALLGALWAAYDKRDAPTVPATKVAELGLPATSADGPPVADAQKAPAPKPVQAPVVTPKPPVAKAVPATESKPAPAPKPAEVIVAKPAPAPTPAAPPPYVAPPAFVAPPVQRPTPTPAAKVAKPLPEAIEPAVEADTPSVAPAETAPKVAVAPPTVAQPRAAAVGGLPASGDSWTYRSSGKWRTSPKRSFQIMVRSVADGVVTDTLRMLNPAGGSGEARGSRAGKPDFIAWRDIGIEFSPYLGSQGDLSRMAGQSGLPAPELYGEWRQWFSSVKWLGRETISVPAGTFNCHKVEVWSNRHSTGTRAMRESEPTSVHYEVWYAPEVKRYVKMQRRILAESGDELEDDVIELVARKP